MSSLTLRLVKGTPLTNAELDANFTALNTDKLESATAASTYQTLSGMSSYLTSATAASTYQTQSGMSSYLTSATAASTYQTQSGMSSYLTSATAASTYQTQAAMSSYLTSATAASTYLPLTGGSVGALTITADSTFSSTGAVLVSKGTTAERPTGVTGKFRFNTTLDKFEGYTSTGWGEIGGGGGAKGGGTDDIFYENSKVVTTNYTLTAGKNAVTAGPVTINDGVTVTIPSGSTWVVL